MIDDLRPYPEYKDSGLPWLGPVPAHWSVRTSKRMFAQSGERAWPEDQQLSATQSHGVILQEEYERRVGRKVVRILNHLDKRKHVEKDDFVISMRSFQGGLERAWCRGAIRSSYVVLKPVKDVHVPYFAHLFKSHPYIQALRRTSEFIRDGQDLTFSNFCDVPLPVVPLDEQKVIADYLDAHAAVVRRFIRNRRRLIEVLNEQKQAIINRAVTRGLDPNVRLKPSGIDWLGDVPEHWEIGQLRRWFEVVDCKHLTVPFVEQGTPLASVREVQKFNLDLHGCKRTTDEWISHLISGGRKPRRGDLIYCRNVSVGACAYVGTDEAFAMGQDVCLIRSNDQNQRFLNYLLHSPFMEQQLSMLLVGSTFNRINVSEIKSLMVILPPRAEQDVMVDHLDGSLSELDTPLAVAAREIDLVREYRTRLIADVVTGKLDVRGFVPAEEIGPVDLEDVVAEENGDEGLAGDDEAEVGKEVMDAEG